MERFVDSAYILMNVVYGAYQVSWRAAWSDVWVIAHVDSASEADAGSVEVTPDFLGGVVALHVGAMA